MDMKEIGRRIKQRRDSLGMQQSELGAKVGVAGGTISRLESAKGGDPTYDMIRKLAHALETSPAWLIDGDTLSFVKAMSRFEADPPIKDALLKIAGWFETSTDHDRSVFRRNMEVLGCLLQRRDTTIRAWAEDSLADISHSPAGA